MGMFEETYGLIPVFISIAMALGYDAIVGGSVIYLGVAVGFAAATINPFTIGIAQEVAGVKMFSGLGYRILCFVVFMGISIWYVWRYARRIQKDPTKSYLYGEKIETLECASREEMMEIKMTTTQKLSCLLFVFTIGILLYGTIKLGWYIDEIATLFIIMTIVSGLVSRFTPSEIADVFIEASKEMMYGALLCWYQPKHRLLSWKMHRSLIPLIPDATMLQHFRGMASAMGMLFAQNIINFFIPSGAGQALITMPICPSRRNGWCQPSGQRPGLPVW